ncbi:hypothetical protein [Saccharothrix sp. HUAS TT1]|uniref:hypothetical protein n=1 Tax=unclassified Saccharothrix TaxID=2593673 RepID=UPI00345BE021
MNSLRRRLVPGFAAALALVAVVTGPANADPPVPTSLTATVDRTTVDYGQGVLISGTIAKQTDTGWVGVSAALIRVYRCAYGSCTEIRATQSMTGGWQVVYYPVQSTSYRAVFDPSGSASTAGLAPASVDLPQVDVRQASATGISAAERPAPGEVRVRGSVTFGSYFIAPVLPPVRLEFSPDGVGWTTVTTVTSTYRHVASYTFEARVAHPASGYWRAVYDGSPTFAQPSTSAPVHVV